MGKTTLIFDLGQVLVHNHPEWAAEKFSRLNGLDISENMKVMGDHIDYMKGEVTPSEFASKHIKSMKLNISEQEFHAIHSDIFSLNKPLFSFLEKIKGRSVLVMLSNTEKVTIDFLRKKYPELFSLFNGRLVLSYEVHMVKPQKEIFYHALEVANAEAGDAVFIDDRIEYIEAARKLGINAFQYTTLESLRENLKQFL
jgi:HAD superfamily hydrolase (TIGR01509 family)